MNPNRWIEEQGLTIMDVSDADICKRHGISYQALYRALRGRNDAPLPVIYVFHRMSHGRVGLMDWVTVSRRGWVAKRGSDNGSDDERQAGGADHTMAQEVG
jgi:hypothetical protein